MVFKPLPDPKPLAVADLDLDRENPRLPDELRTAKQPAILLHMQEHYDLLRVANSISRNGFYPSEPLIAIADGQRYIVVEGNRRLGSLLTLKKVPATVQHKQRWDDLAKSEKIPAQVPVLVAKNRAEVSAIIGYRHIAGIEPWDPWAKARFIGRLVDDEKRSFEEVSEIVSEAVGDVTAAYRNYRILIEVRKKRVKTDHAEESYGVFSRAMTSGPLRKFLGVGTGAEIRPRRNVLPRDKTKEVKELFGWMFGDDAVLGESRDISKLGKVVASKEGLEVLRKTGDLDEAEIASGGRRDRLVKRLATARAHLQKAREDIRKYARDSEVRDLLQECKSALDELMKKA
jgi:hypothetical protein